MGVRGLSSFFDINPELFHPLKIQNTRVVIDGLNFCYYLYLSSKIDFIYGGDYDKFSHLIQEYFSNLKKCNITPIVIFDGAMDISGRKFQTVRSRVVTRLSTAHSISKLGYATRSILPVLAVEVFKAVLKDLNVILAQSDYEADEHIATLARYYNCPVLSLDSDFFIYDIPGGFIKFDSIDSTPEKGEGDCFYLKCSVYYIAGFLEHFPGIDRQILPLFGTLMGNDYINERIFDNFFEHVLRSKKKQVRLNTSKRHIRMISLLQWLQDRSFKDALDRVMQFLTKSDREMVSNLVGSIVDGYSNCQSNILSTVEPSYAKQSPTTMLVTSTSIPLSEWFITGFHSSYLPPFLGNVLVSNKVLLMSQVEDPSQPSANVCSLPFRKAIYSILLCVDEQSSCTVEEQDRKNTNLCAVKVQTELGNSSPTLLDIQDVQIEDKRNFMLKIFSCKLETLVVFPKSLHLLVACLQFIARFANPPITEEFLSSALLSCILLSLNSQTFQEAKLLFNINNADIETANKNTTKFFQKPQHNHAKAFLSRIVHSYSQLQSCLLFSSYLNSLLLKPLPEANIHELCNGSFIYAMTCNLENRTNLELYISELLGRGSGLDSLYNHYKSKLVAIVPPNSLVQIKHKTKLKNLAKKSKTLKTKRIPEQETVNKFSALLLDDCI